MAVNSTRESGPSASDGAPRDPPPAASLLGDADPRAMLAAQLQGILDTASEGILAIDDTRTILMANRAAAEMFRRPIAALVGTSLDLLVPQRLRERHVAHVQAFAAEGQTARRMGQRSPLAGVRADGEEFPIEAGISRVCVDGRHLCTVILRDLSTARRVEADLDRSRRTLAATFDSASVGMVHLDARTRRFLAANPAFVALSGYTEPELLTMTIDRVNHPDNAIDNDRFEVFLRSGQAYEVDRRIVRKDGAVRWVHISGSVVRDAHGEPTRIVGVVQDVTDRHEVEAALRTRESRQGFVIALSDHLVRLVDPPRVIDDALDRLGNFLDAVCVGWAEDPNGDGRLSSEVCHGRGSAAGSAIRLPRPAPAILDHLRHGGTVVMPDVRVHDRLDAAAVVAYQRLGILSTAFVPLHRDGVLRAMLGVHLRTPCDWSADKVAFLEDVAQRLWTHVERARAEQRSHVAQAELAAALASMNDAVCISDTDGRFIELNDAFAAFLRVPAKSLCPTSVQACGDLVEVCTPGGDALPIDGWAVPRALRGETASNVEYRLRRRDTGESWIGSYSFAPIRDGGGRIVGSVVTARDVTALHRMRTELESSQQELRRLVAARDEVQEQERLRIARELHDDLQQRLAAILMEVAIVRGARPPADDPVPDALDRIERLTIDAVGSMRRIVHDLRPTALEHHGLVDALAGLAEDFSRLSGLPCTVDVSQLAASMPASLAPVALCLYRVVQEALNNVSRHAAASRVSIRLSGAADGPLTLEIEDDGNGIAPGAYAKPGSYGLLGMRERVRSVGGTLRMVDRPGGGTIVRIQVPVPNPDSGPDNSS